ncbi:MAG: response regulator [Clostridia bacterium]|nr:response regulator [Clostridia bacterium]
MIKYIKDHLRQIIPTILLAVGIVIALLVFIRDNTDRIARQNEMYLDELTSQRAVSIDSLVSENLTFIRSTAYLYGENLTSRFADVAVIRDYEENTTFDHLRFIDRSGDGYTSRGVRANLIGRDYVQAGLRGESGVAFVPVSDVTGEKEVAFYAPVYYEGEVIGVMVGYYGEAYVKRLLDYELFGYSGEGWLCTRDGTVIGATADQEPENYLAYLEEADACGEAELARITAAFASGESFSFTYAQEGESATGYAVGLGNVDWVLIRNFPLSASRQILVNANSEGVRLIVTLVTLFAVYVLVIAFGFVINQRKMRQANQNANDISSGVAALFDTFLTVDLEAGVYRYISGLPEGGALPVSGAYSDFCEAVCRRVPEEELRRETAESFAPEKLRSQLLDRDVLSVRVHAPLRDDEWFTYNFIALERAQGRPVRLLLACQEVTALHRREEEEQHRLQQALSAAESASRAKTEFLFNMSHDLRTPMNAIIGYTELAGREDVSPEVMRGYIQKIDASSGHLLALINDILEMSRIESGKMTLEPANTDLIAVMNEAKELFAAQMAGKGIDFTVDTDGVRDRWALCDSNRLNRVILNLVSNAFKFTPSGGRVEVRLTQAPDGDGTPLYTLLVRDNGIGMSPEFAQRLFNPFERERTSTVSRTQGTGLGLSITKSIVDLMGGQIEVNTEQGKGTEFTVRLPFPAGEEEQEEEAAGPLARQSIDFSGMRLLLAEDNEINREIATMILSQAGFAVEAAENGREAVDMVARSDAGYYDAVLMDIQMPEMDGYSAARAIRSLPDEALRRVPIVAMTANAFQEDVQEALEAGMNGHIAKPLNVDRMLETLREVLTASALDQA